MESRLVSTYKIPFSNFQVQFGIVLKSISIFNWPFYLFLTTISQKLLARMKCNFQKVFKRILNFSDSFISIFFEKVSILEKIGPF